ncbi:hypothetical protein [Pseudomonas putida]|uniref:Uncharacterized protein n=1 Tax=Pseudomonas putida TaxID=303 RepID=A0A177SB40_PSEPU|nr:hypothetical protein [Pseudomonas putida]OAI84913.1 hypothetical protein AYO28_03250 [Pseudomonas putida]
MSSESKTHFKKAFNSPYLSSADVVGHMTFTIARVALEVDKTKKTKDMFNTAYFVEREIRPGEKLKPMILNVTNSKTLKALTNSPFIEDWQNVKVTIYVDSNVKFGREVMEGLRISPKAPVVAWLTPEKTKQWENAKDAYRRDGNLDAVLSRVSISDEHQQQLIQECSDESAVA